VSHQPTGIGDIESTQDQRSSLSQRVCVVPDAYAQTRSPIIGCVEPNVRPVMLAGFTHPMTTMLLPSGVDRSSGSV
jgi:hypothetical protein